MKLKTTLLDRSNPTSNPEAMPCRERRVVAKVTGFLVSSLGEGDV